jgi:hypothetical protein
MTQPPPDPMEPGPTAPPPARPVLPLEYGNPPPGRGAFDARRLVGSIAYIVLTGAWIRYGAGNRLPARTILGGWLAMTGVLLALSLYLRLRHGRSGYGYGILLVLGVAILLVGGFALLIISICGVGGRI